MPDLSKTEDAFFSSPPGYVLSGGRGTRLGTLCDNCPKPLLPVAGRPFLEFVLRFLHQQGMRHFVFLTGYKGEQVEEFWHRHPLPEARAEFIREKDPLGTGGAVATAVAPGQPDQFMVILNGDSIVQFRLDELVSAARDRDGAVLAVRTDDVSRFGTLEVGGDGILRAFLEKTGRTEPGLVNAGIYCLRSNLFQDVPRGQPLSIEKDLFPRWLAAGARFKVVAVAGPLLDIGIPQSLAGADQFVNGFQIIKN